MEPSAKRRKTLNLQDDEDDEDELFMEPDELNRMRDPDFKLQQRRDQAARKLKSRFEDIFAKYGRDFEGVGDEVDIISGEIVIDNGHMESLKAVEFGDDDDNDGESTDQDDQGPLELEKTVSTRPFHLDPPNLSQMDKSHSPPLFSPFGQQNSYPTPFSSFDSQGIWPPQRSDSIWQAPELSSAVSQSPNTDPTWQAPDLPPSAFLLVGSRQGLAGPRVTKKALPVTHDPDADEEDNLFDETPGGTESREESPLIKKFPAVDSSPNDNSYSDLIKEVIENLPPTPPDIKKMRSLKSLGKPSPLGQDITKKKQSAAKRMKDTRTGRQAKNSLTAEEADSLPAMPDPTPRESVHKSIEEALWKDSDLESFVDVTGVNVRTSSSPQFYVDIHIMTQESGQDEYMGGSAATKTNEQCKAADKSNDEVQGKTLQRSFGRNILDPDFAFSDEDEENLLPRRNRPSDTGMATLAALPPTLPEESSAPQEENNKQSTQEPTAPKAQQGRPRSQKDRPQVSHASVQAMRTEEQRRASSDMWPQEATLGSRPRRVKKSDPDEAHAQDKLAEDASNNDPSPAFNYRQRSPELGDSVEIAEDETTARPEPESQPQAVSKSIQKKPCAAIQPKTPKDSVKLPTTPATAASLISLVSDGEDDEDGLSFNISDSTPSGHHRILVHRPFLPRLSTTTPSSSFSTGGNNNNRRYSSTTITTTTKIPTDKNKRLQKQKRASLPVGSRSIDLARRFFKTPLSAPGKADPTINRAVVTAVTGQTATDESGPDQQQKQKNDTKTPKKHKKRRQLAHSVVRVRRDADEMMETMMMRDDASPTARTFNNGGHDRGHDRGRRLTLDASPVASIIQTPGGSQRRCGDGGWQCQRDFCFVCM